MLYLYGGPKWDCCRRSLQFNLPLVAGYKSCESAAAYSMQAGGTFGLTLCRAHCPHTMPSALTSSSCTGKSNFGQLLSVGMDIFASRGLLQRLWALCRVGVLTVVSRCGGDSLQALMWCSNTGPPLT